MSNARRQWLATAGLSTLAGVLPPATWASAPSPTASPPVPPGNLPPVTLPDTQELALRNAAGQDYRILVSAPPGVPPAQGYGVMIVLDGNAYFGAAAQAMRLLQTFPQFTQDGETRQAAPTLVVGIAYPGDKVLDGPRRSWDFLPPARNPEHVKRLRGAEPGGADAFLDFLVGTLRPALAEHYPLHADRHTLAGHSLGGYFVLHALARRPGAFQRYAAISPSTWWDDLRIATDLRQTRPGSARILLAVAQDEWPGAAAHSTIMLAGARTVRDTLTDLPLEPAALHYLEMPDQDHMTTPFATMAAITRLAAQP